MRGNIIDTFLPENVLFWVANDLFIDGTLFVDEEYPLPALL